MTEQETTIEKMAKDLCNSHGGHRNYETCGDCFGEKDKYFGCKNIAEALIAAGIGDTTELLQKVQELEHKLEVAERVVVNITDVLYSVCRPFAAKEAWIKRKYEQAEKELSEEKNND